MGTCYMLVDEDGRNALDVGKFYALWWIAAGKTGRSTAMDGDGYPVTAEMIAEAAKGWLTSNHEQYAGTDTAELAERQDVRFSTWLAERAARWHVEVAGARALRIYEEGSGPCGDDMDPKEDWGTFWTLYVHPVTKAAPPPFHLFP